MRRITEVAFPEHPGLAERLQHNQQHFLLTHADHYERRRECFEKYFLEYTNAFDAAAEHYADAHPKAALRIAAYRELVETGIVHDQFWHTGNVKQLTVLYKMKPGEFAKPGKYGRMLGDYGVHASLQGFWLNKLLKEAEANEPFVYCGITFMFVASPKRDALNTVFALLMNPPGRGFMCYFSDDACISVRIDGQVYIFNSDINSCDRTHTDAIFDVYVKTTPHIAQADALNLTQQCARPLRIFPVPRKGEKMEPGKYVELTFEGRILTSGWSGTTRINNLASESYGLAIAEAKIEPGDVAGQIIAAAMNAGYSISLEPCPEPEDIQFLKHSPHQTQDGSYEAVLNIGVLLRSSGRPHGDLPGRRSESLRDRANAFHRGLLQGCYPDVSIPIIDVMKKRVGGTLVSSQTEAAIKRAIDTRLAYKVDATPSTSSPSPTTPTTIFFTDAAIFKRYRLTGTEALELQEHCRQAEYGTHFASAAVSRVLSRDYKLTCPGL